MKLCIVLLATLMATVDGADDSECSGNGTKLEQFNGRKETTSMPCKYNAVLQECGPYEIRLTPGNVYRWPHYYVDSLWLSVKMKDGSGEWDGRTENKIAIKYFNGWKDDLFNQKGGNLTTDGLLTFGSTSHATYVKDVLNKFKVTFKPWDPDHDEFPKSEWKFKCMADEPFEPAGYSKQICGSNYARETEDRRKLLDLKTRAQVIYFDVFTNPRIAQMNPQCVEAYNIMTEDCTEEQRKTAVKTCSQILSSFKHTKCVAKYSCDPMDVFLSCITWVCSDFTDNKACGEVAESIDLCRNFTEGDLSAKVEAAGKDCYKEHLHIETD